MRRPAESERDLPARLLEAGLILVVLLAPLPFGAVGWAGRLALECAAVILGLIWVARSLRRETVLPPGGLLAGLLLLVLLAMLQFLPLPRSLIGTVSPRSVEVRLATTAPASAGEAESRLLGLDVEELERSPTLSVDPAATASGLRAGLALAVLLLVATTVAATRGARRLALALLVGAALQALYGLLVLASGFDHIWHLPKEHNLDSATGSYVNRNHFACLLAMSLACGLALILRESRGNAVQGLRSRFVALLSGQTLLWSLLLLVGIAGLLASLSRAGIALGLGALLATLVAGGGRRGLGRRLVVGALLASVALIPLLQLGAERLTARFAETRTEWTSEDGRSTVLADTLHIAAAFPWFGSGYGSFAAIYPLYRSPQIRKFYSHAHNDAAQALAEGGAVGAIGLLLFLWPIARTIVLGLSRAKGTLAVGLAAGLAAFLLHSLIDFNAHIPANGAIAAILAGTLLGLPWRSRH